MKVKFSSLQVLDNYGKGYADGEEKGFNDGLKTGNEQGYNSALERLETTDITANGTYTPNDIGFKKVVVNVPDLNGDYQTGYNDGYDKGNTDGYSQGYSKGETDGYNDGYTKGENVGYTNGYEQGNTDGFNSGYTQGESVGTENGYNNALSKLDELTITQNGEYTPSEDKIGFSKVIVETVDENGSFEDGYSQGLAQGGQKFKNRISGTPYSLTAQDLDGLTEIQDYAFYYDQKIQSIDIPENLTSIGEYAFYYCRFRQVNYNAIDCSIEMYAFSNAGNINDTKLVIGKEVSKFSSRAFSSFSYLTSVVFEENAILSIIAERMFYNCSRLTSITIPDNITSIGRDAFNGCSSLINLTIPISVGSVGQNALKIGSSENKATITMLKTTPPPIQPNTFNASFLNQIIVPKGCGDIYKSSTNWSSFADYIVESET